ncbi:MAG: hypothetical protein ISQ11_09020, partial [Planctomycetes bacterium]|nr:hypothetical protein [Planctomycetota bacterium]
MDERLLNALHVLDSSIWIDLIDRHPDLLYKVVDLANLSVLQIGVPGTVHLEMTRNAPERLAARKRDWHARIGELIRFAEMLRRTEDPFGPDGPPSRSYVSALEAMRGSIDDFEGDPHHGMVTDLLRSKHVTAISEPKAIHAQVVEYGISKKKPYGGKNSTADATILFATARWAARHPDRDVFFHT